MAIKASELVTNSNLTQNSSSRTPRKSSKLEREKPSSNSPRNSIPKPPSWLHDPSTIGSTFGSCFNYLLDTSIATISVSSHTSLSNLLDTLPENSQIYDFSEIPVATNNFLAKRYSSTSSSKSWRSVLNGKDVIIFQRKLRIVRLNGAFWLVVCSQWQGRHHCSSR
ncbi:lysM domain receptor-like kinase 3 [Forsythia ovata]|uniref:LysM domain receptor-like kinase 3 n=1 Tax=Forsythia ovata TaxID=205694 RepID=A0ABD1W947_9LAMI